MLKAALPLWAAMDTQFQELICVKCDALEAWEVFVEEFKVQAFRNDVLTGHKFSKETPKQKSELVLFVLWFFVCLFF